MPNLILLWPTRTNAIQCPKTFPVGETCRRSRNGTNSKTHKKVENKYNRNVLQIITLSAESQNKYINSKHTTNTSRKHTNPEKKLSIKSEKIHVGWEGRVEDGSNKHGLSTTRWLFVSHVKPKVHEVT